VSGRVRRGVAVAGLAIAAAVWLLAYAVTWRTGALPQALALGCVLATVGQLALFALLGARRADGRAGAAWGAAAVLLLGVGGLFAAVLLAPDLGAAEPLLGGLPRRAALVLLGVGLLPLPLLALAFARGFDAWTPSAEDVARLKALVPPSARPPGEGAG
jgi:hypothetical protein